MGGGGGRGGRPVRISFVVFESSGWGAVFISKRGPRGGKGKVEEGDAGGGAAKAGACSSASSSERDAAAACAASARPTALLRCPAPHARPGSSTTTWARRSITRFVPRSGGKEKEGATGGKLTLLSSSSLPAGGFLLLDAGAPRRPFSGPCGPEERRLARESSFSLEPTCCFLRGEVNELFWKSCDLWCSVCAASCVAVLAR